ncbi:MAG: IclR family transcriptional regulator [Betaproteobacteria bacterium]|nr:IclR family transcriptional regulator [Betaproteobacteria bacterium]
MNGHARQARRTAAIGRSAAAGAVPKAMRVLEAVAGRKRPLSITEIAAALDLPHVLQAAAGSGASHTVLATLAKKTGESCNLGVMAGGNVVYVDRVESQWPLGLRFEPGSRVPLHCTAIGKLLLSELPGAALDTYLANGPLTRYTATTITDPRRLKEELRRIRRQGFSTDNQEFMSGVVCIAAPVHGPQNGRVCAGLAISAAEARLTLTGVKRFLPHLRQAAAKLSRSLTDGRAG